MFFNFKVKIDIDVKYNRINIKKTMYIHGYLKLKLIN